ncbi:MAG: hypothetical protein R2876_02465 [Eubacteriales bacterium]
MKKVFLLTLIIIMVMSFAACGSSSTSEASQSPQTTQSEEPSDSETAQTSDDSITTQSSVEVLNGNVVETRYTGDIKQVFTYHFQNDEIVSADIVVTCSDATTAQTMYDILQMTNDSFQTYDNLKITGNTVSADYSDTALAAYEGKTAEELKTYLEETATDTE